MPSGRMPGCFGTGCTLAVLGYVLAATAAPAPADTVYRNGNVYTVDAKNSVQQALAVRSGTIVFVGSDVAAQAFIGPQTTVHDLQGGMLMPGLVDGHMHPLMGGRTLLKCNLNYARLTVTEMQARIQECLDASKDREPDGWLEVVNWFQEAMRGGTETSRATLDALRTQRPILVMSSFGHTALVNTRGLALSGITAATPDPPGGKIERDPSGQPTGLLQDAGFGRAVAAIPKSTAVDDINAAEAALDALRAQGVTTFLDAAASEETLAAFAGAEKRGKLTARAHFAVLIKPTEGQDPKQAVARVKELARRYDEGPIGSQPHLTVRNIKLFLDGVITAPACTGAMIAPYFVNQGSPDRPHWVAGANRGPAVYFPAPILKAVILEAAAAGFEPHMHTDGDRAVREGLDAIETLRQKFPPQVIRAALAHDEIVDPADFPRYGVLDAIPVLSFQWEKPAPDTVDGAQDYLGPTRYPYIEPAAFLADAGARTAFGSDWPVDPLDEWFALKVAVTRTNAPEAESKYRGRLGRDRGLSRRAMLRAATLNSSYELHQDDRTGSLEVGKLADLIILDRNVLEIPAEQIANVKVLQTIVGGRVVYDAARH
jgi:predicted amidohydrolase YtcJ